MLEAIQQELLAGVAASAAAGIIGSFGWITGRLWRMYRHEIRDMKDVNSKTLSLVQQHIDHDAEIHRELMGAVGELRGYVKGKLGDHTQH